MRHGNAIHPSDYTPTHLNYIPEPSEGIQHTESGNGGTFGGRKAGRTDLGHELLGDAFTDGILGAGHEGDGVEDEGEDGRIKAKWKGTVHGMSTTQWLARRHNIRGRRIMFVHPHSVLYSLEIELLVAIALIEKAILEGKIANTIFCSGIWHTTSLS